MRQPIYVKMGKNEDAKYGGSEGNFDFQWALAVWRRHHRLVSATWWRHHGQRWGGAVALAT